MAASVATKSAMTLSGTHPTPRVARRLFRRAFFDSDRRDT